MFVLYVYDLKPNNPGEYNRLKRRFYYKMNNLDLPKLSWKTKSVMVVPLEYEVVMDNFFLSFKPQIEVYKAQTKYVEEL